MNKGLTPSQIDAIEIAVMLGFADIKGEGKTCVIMRADDAQSLVSGIEKTDYAAVLKKLEMFDKCITALVMLYGIIEIDEAVDRIKEEMVIDGGIAGIKRMLYWHSRMMNIVETSSNLQSHVAYVQIPGLNGNRIIEYRNREKIDNVLGYKPYKRGFLKTYDGNIAEMYECWADMHGLLTYVYGMDDDIAGEFCIDLFYMVSDRAASADDLYNSILEKCGADSPFTKAAVYECCLACVNDTDIPQLMGHSREDYYKKTGRWPGGLLFGNGKRKKIERDTPPGFLPETDQHKMLFISTSEAIENNREKALKGIDELTEKYSDNLVVLAIAVDPYVAVGHREKAKRVLQTLRLMDHSLGKEIKYITERIDLKKNRDADEKVPDSQFMPSGTIWDMEDNLYTPQPQIERQHPKVGRNDPCPCGSGKKFKKCCQGKGIYD